MNNSIYEEYMRSVLGYNPTASDYNLDTYDIGYNNYNIMQNTYNMDMIQNEDLEDCYPDTYKLVYPMVQRACMQNTKTITRELIEDMTNEIYYAIEDDEKSNTRNNSNTKNVEYKKEDRQTRIRNQGLNDIIRILLLRELLGKPGFRPRPPFGPGRPPIRPPFRI